MNHERKVQPRQNDSWVLNRLNSKSIASVDILVALIRIRATAGLVLKAEANTRDLQHRLLAKNDMPGKLHDIGDGVIRQLNLRYPAVKMLVIAQRTLHDLLPGNGELRAARDTNGLGNGCIVEELFVSILIEVFGERRAGRVAERLNLRGAAGGCLTPQIDVAVALDKVSLQGADGFDIVKGRIIHMPGGRAVFMIVEEDNGRRKVVVVVDNVLEIREALLALVLWGMVRRGQIVDGVDHVSPSVCQRVPAEANQRTRPTQRPPRRYPPRPAWP